MIDTGIERFETLKLKLIIELWNENGQKVAIEFISSWEINVNIGIPHLLPNC